MVPSRHHPTPSPVSSSALTSNANPAQPPCPSNPHRHPNYNAPSRNSKLPKDPKEQFKRRGSDLIRKVSNKDRYAIFLEAVDLKQVPHYADVIKRPMDLSLVQKNLDMGVYRTPMEMRADLDLIWSNCCTFNADNSMYYREAVRLRALCTRYYDDLIRLLTRDGVGASLGIQPPTPTSVNPNNFADPNFINSNSINNNSSTSNLPSSHEFHSFHHRNQYAIKPTNPSAPNQRSNPSHPYHSNKRPTPGSRLANSLPGSIGGVVPSNPMFGAADELDSGLAARHFQQVRNARQDLKSAIDAASVARTEVTQTARKAGVSAAQCLIHEGRAEAESEPSKPKQIFNGPGNLINDKSRLAHFYRSPHEFPIISSNSLLRDSALEVPRTWARIGRGHPGLPPPFLSQARAADVRNGRRYETYVRKYAPSARRLLATVLDVSVVDGEDRKRSTISKHTSSKRRKRCNEKGNNSMDKSNPDHALLVELVGENRACKAVETPRKEEDKLLPQPGRHNLEELDKLLKSQGVDTGILETLAAADGHAISESGQALSGLLNANYEGMVNCLRLRALRDAVNEAEREELEDRERECVECVAKGVAKAVSQLPPKMLVHGVDATESALNLCAAIQTCNNGATNTVSQIK